MDFKTVEEVKVMRKTLSCIEGERRKEDKEAH